MRRADDPQPSDRRRPLARRDPRGAARQRRLRLRPAVPDPATGQDRRRAATGATRTASAIAARRLRALREAAGCPSPEASWRRPAATRRMPALACRLAPQLHGAAAAVALHPLPVVRAQMSVLRFQFARSARRACRSTRYVDALLADLEAGAAAGLGAQGLQRFLRRRHAEPVFGRGRSTRMLAGVRARVPLRPTPRSRWKPIPARSKHEKFRGFRGAGVNRLSIGIQSFNRRASEGAGPHPRRRASARARSRSRAPASTTSISI